MAAPDSSENSVGSSRTRSRVRSPADEIVPEEVRARFKRLKNRYYFPDGTRAFTDRGHRLTTRSENTEVVRSLVAIARARDWGNLTVAGTERFRREAWVAARSIGLEVQGYQPTELEQSRLLKLRGRESAGQAKETANSRTEVKRDRLLTGRLLDHGRAPYRQDPHQAMSYFVKLETGRGERVIWGVDLERAFRESSTRPEVGDDVGLRAIWQEAVKVKTDERDLDTHRNRWVLEKRDFFESRAAAAGAVRDPSVDPKEAVKRHPELVGTYLQVHAAELASKRFRNPQDRERFVEMVRSALADSVARGAPLPPVRFRDRISRREQAREREAELGR